MHDPLNVLIDYLNRCQTGAQNRASEIPRKRNSSKKHSDRTAKKAKSYSSARRTLDTPVEEIKVVVATLSVGTVISKRVPFKTHGHSIDNNSSFPSTTILSPTNNPSTFGLRTNPCQTTSITTSTKTSQLEQVLSEIVPAKPPVSTPQTINPNVTIPLPTSSPFETLTYNIIPTPQPQLPSQLSQLENPYSPTLSKNHQPENTTLHEPHDSDSNTLIIESYYKDYDSVYFKPTSVPHLWMNCSCNSKVRLLTN